VTIGLLTLEIQLPQARSLKDKRQVLRSVKDRLRAHHNVAVCELPDHANVWQRAGLAVVTLGMRRDPLDALFEAIVREIEGQIPGHLLETGRDFLDAADGGPGGWGDLA
jgi:uncharacterized protein YlxP (DUF503 family)